MKTLIVLLVLSTSAVAQKWYGFNGPNQQQMQEQLRDQQEQLNQMRNDADKAKRRAIMDEGVRSRPSYSATAAPLVTFINGVPQPPVLINSIKSGTRALNEARTKAYLAALAEFNANAAQQQQLAAQDQQRDKQIAALQQEMARLAAELKKVNQRANVKPAAK